MTFKCLNDTVPAYLKELTHSYTPNRSLRSTSKNYLAHEQFHPKSSGLRVFSFAAPFSGILSQVGLVTIQNFL